MIQNVLNLWFGINNVEVFAKNSVALYQIGCSVFFLCGNVEIFDTYEREAFENCVNKTLLMEFDFTKS